ncbi:TPA: hypothetical protein HNC39_20390 [Escherichia coli]|nr:hypothetical protein [Escherichia coli]EFC9509669.1 hypothetical protein [Escherichia coli]EFD5224659.1 hypothetical protein [Escherichia coli]EFE6301290.1 hypothetical protein [Escherichia coli]EFE6981392.1 hypothetical protein [Escherichia coli]
MHGFACVSLPHFLQTAPFPAQPERVSTTALKPPHKAGGRGGESIARQVIFNLFFYKGHLTQVSKEIEMEPRS